MKSVNVQYFALLRDEAGVERETLNVDLRTYKDLYLHLKEKHRFTLPLEMIQLAVDDEFSDFDLEIRESSRVVFIPPVAGG